MVREEAKAEEEERVVAGGWVVAEAMVVEREVAEAMVVGWGAAEAMAKEAEDSAADSVGMAVEGALEGSTAGSVVRGVEEEVAEARDRRNSPVCNTLVHWTDL